MFNILSIFEGSGERNLGLGFRHGSREGLGFNLESKIAHYACASDYRAEYCDGKFKWKMLLSDNIRRIARKSVCAVSSLAEDRRKS